MGRIHAHTLDGEPGANRHFVARESLGAPVRERPGIRGKTGELCPPEESVEHVRGHGVPRFGFHRVEKVRFFDQKIDFVPGPISPEKQRGLRRWCR